MSQITNLSSVAAGLFALSIVNGAHAGDTQGSLSMLLAQQTPETQEELSPPPTPNPAPDRPELNTPDMQTPPSGNDPFILPPEDNNAEMIELDVLGEQAPSEELISELQNRGYSAIAMGVTPRGAHLVILQNNDADWYAIRVSDTTASIVEFGTEMGMGKFFYTRSISFNGDVSGLLETFENNAQAAPPSGSGAPQCAPLSRYAFGSSHLPVVRELFSGADALIGNIDDTITLEIIFNDNEWEMYRMLHDEDQTACLLGQGVNMQMYPDPSQLIPNAPQAPAAPSP
jgi:hypothetical protein